MVPPARLERATYGLEGRRSIQLSYGSISKINSYLNDWLGPSQILCGRDICVIYPGEHLVKHLGEVKLACIDDNCVIRNSQRRIFARDVAFVTFVDLGERLFVS